MSIASLVYRAFKTRSVPLFLLNRVKLKGDGARSLSQDPLAYMRAALPRDVIEHEQVPRDTHVMPRLAAMHHGDKVASVFSETEMMRRLASLRRYMAENSVGVAVLTSVHNVNYYSGFLYTAFGRPYGVVVTMDKCATISAAVDGGQPWRRSYDDNVTYTDWQKGNFFHAVRKAVGDVPGALGLEFDTVSLDTFKSFQDMLPNMKKVDVSGPTMQMRMVKSPEELQLTRQGARIADVGGRAAVSALRDDVTEYDVALASTDAMVREIARTYPDAELRDTWTWLQSGINTDGAHNAVTSRRVKHGDILNLNCFPMISGYYAALERTLFLGAVSEAQLRVWEVNCEVHRRGCELLQPGMRCCDVASELNHIYRAHDLIQYRTFGYGHSFGTLCHYYGREAALELREDVCTVLQPGMVVSMEPMVMIPPGHPAAGGYREHDILIITPDGAENITGFPYGPEHNIIQK